MWHSMFAVQVPIAEKVLRTVVVYATILILFRLTGKRDLASLNIFDFVVLFLLSNVVQNAIIGSDNSHLARGKGVRQVGNPRQQDQREERERGARPPDHPRVVHEHGVLRLAGGRDQLIELAGYLPGAAGQVHALRPAASGPRTSRRHRR